MSGSLSPAQVNLIDSQNDLASRDPSLQTYDRNTGLPAVFPGLDDVSITVGSTQFAGWESVRITASCESLPRSFALAASTQFMQTPGALAATRPGQACVIKIGTDQIINGWIDRRTISADPRNHQVTISGRGICRNLVDCSVDLADSSIAGGNLNSTSVLDLAQKLCHAYGITARMAVSATSIPLTGLQLHVSDTPFTVIESACRFCGFILYEDQNGNLVIDRVGTASHSSGAYMPGNIESINADRSVDGRYSDYYCTWETVDSLGQLGPLSQRIAHIMDDTVTEHRVLTIVSEQLGSPVATESNGYQLGPLTAQQRAQWEKARRIGRSQAVSVTVDSWRDDQGILWTPNKLIPINAPNADVSNASWLIGTVTFTKTMAGTHAMINAMPPDAFNPEPDPLNLFNNELANTPQTSQNPAPPSTSTSGLAVGSGTV